MRKVKIIHFSDVHFDTPFSGLPKELGDIRRAELRECFSRIIDLAIRNSSDLIIISGDIFDNFTVERETLNFLQKEFTRLENSKVFIAAGNHDPYNEGSFYKMIKWGKNVHIFSETIEEIYLPELDVVIYGSSFKKKYIKQSQLKNFKLNDNYKNSIKIMALHGTITNSNVEEYNPITLEEIANTQVDYLALGHIHKFSGINRIENTYYAYCGCPEGRGFDELGEKGIILGEVGRNYANLSFVPTNKRTYNEVQIDITQCYTNKEIINKILEKFNDDYNRTNLYKIILKGEISEELKIKERLLEELLKDKFFFIKIIDKTRLKINRDKLKDEFSLKGIFCSKIIEELENCTEEEREEIELAFKFGIQELCSEDVKLDDY